MHNKLLLFLIITLFLFIISTNAYGEEGSAKVNISAGIVPEAEIIQMRKDLASWTDPELINLLSDISLTSDYIEDLYEEFLRTIVNPPDPDTYTKYTIRNPRGSLINSERLGRRIHNLLLASPGEQIARYERLICIMRDVLYIDSRHIPYAISHDNSRDIYWYELHKRGVEEAKKEYHRLLISTIER